MFGYSSADALGRRLALMNPEHLHEGRRRDFDAAMSNGNARLGGCLTLTRGLHKSGQKLYVEMSFAVAVDEAGSPCGSVAVARNVTERVEREKAAGGGTVHMS